MLLLFIHVRFENEYHCAWNVNLDFGRGRYSAQYSYDMRLPIDLRDTFKQKCVWASLESFVFYDNYVTQFKKSLPWMPWVIVLVSHEEICSILHYGKRPQFHYCRILAESRHCQTLFWTCMPQVYVASQILQNLFLLPGTYRQGLNMWTAGATIFRPSVDPGLIPFGGHQKIIMP